MYHSCQSLGLMLSGALQTAIYESLNGHSGVAGWRWMFVSRSTFSRTELS